VTATATSNGKTIDPVQTAISEDGQVVDAPPKAPAERKIKPYAVFEVIESKDDVPTKLEFVCSVEAFDKTEARWAAVDKTPALKKRVTAKDGQSGEPVVLLPISARSLSGAEATFEKVEQVIARA
jgi:hypothetical protein